MDRHSTGVPEVTRTRAELLPDDIDGMLPDRRPTAGRTRWFRTNATTLRRTGEPMPPSDLLSALLDPVRAATPRDGTRAHDPRDAHATRLTSPCRHPSHRARTLPANELRSDRLFCHGRPPSVRSGDVRRFDVEIARWDVPPTRPRSGADSHAVAARAASCIRRVSRESRHRGACARRGRVCRRSRLEPRRSIEPCDATADAWCWHLRHQDACKPEACRASA